MSSTGVFVCLFVYARGGGEREERKCIGFLLVAQPCIPLLLGVLLMRVSRTLTFSSAREAFSSLDVSLGFFEISLIITHLAFWGDLGWPTTPGEDGNGAKLSPIVHNLPDIGLVESKLFGNSFIAVSSLFHQYLFFRDPQISPLFRP